MATVVVHTAEIDKMKSWDGEIGRSITRLAREIVFRQRAMANRRSGFMAGKMHWIRKNYASGIGFWAGSNAPYTLYPDQGTKPHPIYPKKPGGRLVFFWPKVGHVVILRSVQHPGNRGSKFLERGLRRGMSVWERSG